MERRVVSLSDGQRILAAIMVTDAVGFSARMSQDEGLTLRLIDRDLTLIAQSCVAFGGRVLKSTGDGLLMYFLSAVEAVSCGLEIQRCLVEQAAGLPPDQYLDHRIGIHLGDIVVSEQDVMGNGVNITARLQTYAQPRGLCVSQTVFDVVKARLNLNAVFLGALDLKNIHEPVPAYQINPYADPDSGPLSTGDPTYTVPMSPEDLLGAAVNALMAHDQALRVKKLIFAIYQQAWENDPAVLNQFDLRTLLMALRDRYPTAGDLEIQLQRVVLGLNRQGVYAEVAALILRTVHPWYVRTLKPTTEELENEATVLTVRSLEERCVSAAQQLNQQADGLRLRKLLYCLAHNTWENDNAVLEQVDLPSLIQQVVQAAPQIQDLRYHLGRIVGRLNRRREYTRLANILIQVLQPIYATTAMQLSVPPSSDVQDSAPEHTVVTPMATQIVSGEPEVTTLQTATPPLAHQGIAVSGAGIGYRPVRDRRVLFDLRVDIAQYANPLRAKILLHSCLHGPFSFTSQDWGTLKRTTLEDLLHSIFEYCPSYADLESKLTIMAHCLGQSEEIMPVADSITRAIRAYYPQDPDMALEPLPPPQEAVPSPGSVAADSITAPGSSAIYSA
ncbi:MAG: adenylate/guanylate cyclase domain-containing protein [Leptolyngbya sp.]|nr:adenylate/guanylate cyclase domain-containing protein [Leptolyngbya sp.]